MLDWMFEAFVRFFYWCIDAAITLGINLVGMVLETFAPQALPWVQWAHDILPDPTSTGFDYAFQISKWIEPWFPYEMYYGAFMGMLSIQFGKIVFRVALLCGSLLLRVIRGG